jgi:hypothetical protein
LRIAEPDTVKEIVDIRGSDSRVNFTVVEMGDPFASFEAFDLISPVRVSADSVSVQTSSLPGPIPVGSVVILDLGEGETAQTLVKAISGDEVTGVTTIILNDNVLSEFTTVPGDMTISPLRPVVDRQFIDIGDLAEFDTVRFDYIVAALENLGKFLDLYAALPVLTSEVPLIGKDLNTLFPVAEGFNKALDDLKLSQGRSLQTLGQKIRRTWASTFQPGYGSATCDRCQW